MQVTSQEVIGFLEDKIERLEAQVAALNEENDELKNLVREYQELTVCCGNNVEH